MVVFDDGEDNNNDDDDDDDNNNNINKIIYLFTYYSTAQRPIIK
jgi:hypothetical protein